MKTYAQFKKKLLSDEKLKHEYDALEPDFEIARAIIEKRLEKGLTQSQLAQKIGTKQSAISRLESGTANPSVQFLGKVAQALDLRLVVTFA
jgi:ribosome-binding protein aMBF1 (putative translation factor)